MIDGSEIFKHNSTKSCWIVVHGQAYDVTGALVKQIEMQDQQNTDPADRFS